MLSTRFIPVSTIFVGKPSDHAVKRSELIATRLRDFEMERIFGAGMVNLHCLVLVSLGTRYRCSRPGWIVQDLNMIFKVLRAMERTAGVFEAASGVRLGGSDI